MPWEGFSPMDKSCSSGCLKQVDPSEANVTNWTFSYSLVEIAIALGPQSHQGMFDLTTVLLIFQLKQTFKHKPESRWGTEWICDLPWRRLAPNPGNVLYEKINAFFFFFNICKWKTFFICLTVSNCHMSLSHTHTHTHTHTRTLHACWGLGSSWYSRF